MINVKELPLILFLFFTLIYATVGDPNSEVWSGLYFFVNYATLFVLFKSHRSKTIRKIGMSLSVAILVFIALKYLLHLQVGRAYTLIPFFICLIGLVILERKNDRNRPKSF